MSLLEDLKRVPSILWQAIVFIATFSIIYSCQPGTENTEPPVVQPPGVSFSVVQLTDTILTIQVRWTEAQDAYGTADSYIHTMTASRVVTDSTTGPLPTDKSVLGLADTVRIRVNLVNDTVTLTSQVWSVRRGLQSTSAAQGRLVIRRGDVPPPPPDSITVDTIIIAMVFGGGSINSSYSICCGQNPAGPWLDTVPFNRVYATNPGAPYVGLHDWVSTAPGGETVVTSYHHPLVKFRFNPSGFVTHAVDSNTAIFQVLPFATSRYIWIVAEYSGRKDSLRTYVFGTSVANAGYCAPWPDCYYNPQLYAPQMPELPRVYINTDYVPPDTIP